MWINVTFIMVTKVTMSYKPYYTHNKNVNREIRQNYLLLDQTKNNFWNVTFLSIYTNLEDYFTNEKFFYTLRYWNDYL